MEPSFLGLILDSSVVIEAETQHFGVARFLRHIANKTSDKEVALCAIRIAELAHGIHRANTPERRQARRAFLDDLLIAGCALERGYAIATINVRHFRKIPGLTVLSL